VFRSRSYTSSKRASDRKLSFPDHVFLWWHTLRTMVVRCRSCRRSHACPLPSIRKLRRHRHRREKTPPLKEDLPPCDGPVFDEPASTVVAGWTRAFSYHAADTRAYASTHPRDRASARPTINRAVTRREWVARARVLFVAVSSTCLATFATLRRCTPESCIRIVVAQERLRVR